MEKNNKSIIKLHAGVKKRAGNSGINPDIKTVPGERIHVENIVNQRFHFLLIFFTFIIAGALNAKCQLYFNIIFSIGFLISFLIMWAIWRAHSKFI
jgi:hypothetical protein